MSGFVTYTGPRPAPSRDAGEQAASTWSPFQRKIFLALWMAALASNVGTWMQNVGAAWLMTSLSPSPLMVSLIQTASSLPIFFLALPGGALADIVDRRRLLIFSQAWMLAAASILAALTMLHATTATTLLLMSFMLGIGSALNAPAWQAIIPELVPRDQLTQAVTLNGINFNLARAAGPALGGLVVASLGAGAAFALNAVSFLGVVMVLFLWRRERTPGVLPAERVIGAIRAGIRYVRYAPELRAVLVRTAAFVIGGSAMWAVLPLVAKWRLGTSAAGFGVLLGWFGAGAVVGGATLGRIEQRFSHDTIVRVGMIVFAAISGGLAITQNFYLAGALLAVGGAAWTCSFSVLNVAAQLSIPQWVQGRALAVYQIVIQGGMAGASIIWGALGERFGLPIALIGGAAALTLGLAASWRYWLVGAETLDTEIVPSLPAPTTALDLSPDCGPALIQIEYRIEPRRAEEFVAAMREIRLLRLRDGAVYWGLFFDSADPARFVEQFLAETWLEHLRQHERMTASDAIYYSHATTFNTVGELPAVEHLISAEAIPRHLTRIETRKSDGKPQSSSGS